MRGPVLVIDAVRAYAAAVRGTPSSDFRLRTLDRMAAAIGRYWPLVEIDDEEFTAAVGVLWRDEPHRTRHDRVVVVRQWVDWCRTAQLPAPALLPPAGSERLRRSARVHTGRTGKSDVDSKRAGPFGVGVSRYRRGQR